METYNGEKVVRTLETKGLLIIQTADKGSSPDGEGSLNTYVIERG